IVFVGPNEKALSVVLYPVRTKEYAKTTRFDDRAIITINPMVFDEDALKS
ncbi:unnamed protein product, partial [Rotaria sp. Silwood1]